VVSTDEQGVRLTRHLLTADWVPFGSKKNCSVLAAHNVGGCTCQIDSARRGLQAGTCAWRQCAIMNTGLCNRTVCRLPDAMGLSVCPVAQLYDLGLRPETAFGCAMNFLVEPLPEVKQMFKSEFEVGGMTRELLACPYHSGAESCWWSPAGGGQADVPARVSRRQWFEGYILKHDCTFLKILRETCQAGFTKFILVNILQGTSLLGLCNFKGFRGAVCPIGAFPLGKQC
jgi:hypothetical protein